MAFAVADRITFKPKNDPAFVQWKAFHATIKDGVQTDIDLDIRLCDDGHFAQIY